MKKLIALIVVSILMSGCAVVRHTQVTAGANGVKTKAYGALDEGSVLIDMKTEVYLFRCGRQE